MIDSLLNLCLGVNIPVTYALIVRKGNVSREWNNGKNCELGDMRKFVFSLISFAEVLVFKRLVEYVT